MPTGISMSLTVFVWVVSRGAAATAPSSVAPRLPAVCPRHAGSLAACEFGSCLGDTETRAQTPSGSQPEAEVPAPPHHHGPTFAQRGIQGQGCAGGNTGTASSGGDRVHVQGPRQHRLQMEAATTRQPAQGVRQRQRVWGGDVGARSRATEENRGADRRAGFLSQGLGPYR